MATLQIRDLPEHVYQALAVRARRNRRSLAQQAVVDLSQVEKSGGRESRLATIAVLRRSLEDSRGDTVARTPEELMREDRER